MAIKVLPAQLSDNLDILQRIDREAKAISGLNHPNLFTLYDVGSQHGIDVLVMEFLLSEIPAMRLSKGVLSAAEVLGVAAISRLPFHFRTRKSM